VSERFLVETHDTVQGATARAFGDLPVVLNGRPYRSSYEVLAALIPHVSTRVDVLDLACGDGFLLSLLAARSQPNLALCGIDLSAGELRAARVRIGAAARVVRCRAQDLSLSSRRFDYVTSHMALMLMDSPQLVVGEVSRVLKPGGTFGAIVGAAPPASAALSAFGDLLSHYPRQAQWSEVRLGDRRMRSRDAMAELLSQSLREVVIEDLHINRRLTPRELWGWFSGTYDVYFLSDADRVSLEHEYIAAMSAECDADGRVHFPWTIRSVTARAV